MTHNDFVKAVALLKSLKPNKTSMLTISSKDGINCLLVLVPEAVAIPLMNLQDCGVPIGKSYAYNAKDFIKLTEKSLKVDLAGKKVWGSNGLAAPLNTMNEPLDYDGKTDPWCEAVGYELDSLGSLSVSEPYRKLIEETQSKDENQFNLNGFYVDSTENSAGDLTVVATDGHCLSAVKGRGLLQLKSGVVGVLLDGTSATIAHHLLKTEGRIAFAWRVSGMGNGLFRFYTLGGLQVTIKGVDGTFPEYRQVIPERLETQKFLFTNDDLLQNTLGHLAKGQSGYWRPSLIKFDWVTKSVTIEDTGALENRVLTAPITLNASLPATQIKGFDQIGVNPAYLLKTLKAFGPIVPIYLQDEMAPLTCTAPDGSISVIMPARI